MRETDPAATHTMVPAKRQTRGHSSGCHSMSTSCIQLCSPGAYYVLGPKPGDSQLLSLTLTTAFPLQGQLIIPILFLRLIEVEEFRSGRRIE